MHVQGHVRIVKVSYELQKLTGGVAREAIRVATSNSRVYYNENEVWAWNLGLVLGEKRRETDKTREI